jgi:hypothetical protein
MSVSDQPTAPKLKRRWHQYCLWLLLLVVVLISAMTAAVALWKRTIDVDYSLPDSADIVAMKVNQWCDGINVQRYKTMPGFEVPENQWAKILAALSPYEYENTSHATSVFLADVEIDMPKRHCRLILFDTFNQVGHFCINHRYCRGGNNLKLKEALENAYIEAERRKGNTTVSFPKMWTKDELFAKFNAALAKRPQGAGFKDRNEAVTLFGRPDATYGPAANEDWYYYCADGQLRIYIVEQSAGEGTGKRILAVLLPQSDK